MTGNQDPRVRITQNGVEVESARLTPWPDLRIVTSPEVRSVPTPRVVDGQWVIYDGDMSACDVLEPSRVEVPDDLYLHEIADTNPSDPDGLLKLAAIGEWRREPADAGAHHLYAEVADNTDQFHRLLSSHRRRYLSPAQFAKRVSVRQLAHERERLSLAHNWSRVDHLDEIGMRVATLHEATRALTAYSDGVALPDVEWFNFAAAAQLGLSVWQARVILEFEGRESTALFSNPPTVYSACWLHIFNDLQSRISLSICTNETCGRRFVHQRGRAKYGQHRTSGVAYCSAACAKAQAQREYRRRQRTAGK